MQHPALERKLKSCLGVSLQNMLVDAQKFVVYFPRLELHHEVPVSENGIIICCFTLLWDSDDRWLPHRRSVQHPPWWHTLNDWLRTVQYAFQGPALTLTIQGCLFVQEELKWVFAWLKHGVLRDVTILLLDCSHIKGLVHQITCGYADSKDHQ